MIRRLLIVAVTAAALATPASAGIAIFTDGRNMKISAYKVVDQTTIELAFSSGGSILMPLARIERIVDDEVVVAEVVAEVKKIVEEGGVFPQRSWNYDESRKPLFNSKYNDVIVAAAKHFDVDAALVSAVIKAESDYNPKTVSHKGATGLMQLMPGTAARFGVVDSFDPVANIYGGTRYLRWLLKTFKGNADHAVAAYNAGEGNVWKYKGVPPFRETVTYINRIAKHIRKADEQRAKESGAAAVATSAALR
jgi:soluble lytic murein transglycosylase-like protein